MLNGVGNDEDPFQEPGRLLESQQSAVRIIVNGFRKLVIENRVEIARANDPPAQDDPHNNRPHQVFLIDGARGAGKTYTLMSVDSALTALGKRVEAGDVDEQRSKPAAWIEKINQWTSKEDLNELKKVPPRGCTLLHTLQIIFPGDMEDGDAMMEALFAKMAERSAIDPNAVDSKDRHTKREKLKKNLTNVAQGWYFARRFGYDALVRDSADYQDLVTRFEDESRKASNRIDQWRTFLHDYLQFHKAAMLVVLLDDSDVKPELTENILHAIRMYLDHPRIVTVLAGHLKSMRNSLLHLEMKRLGPAMQALNKENTSTARGWRRHEQQTIEDYLEKVLPPAQRVRVGRPSLVPLKKHLALEEENTDFKKIVTASLSEVCRSVMDLKRSDFVQTKFHLAIERELNRSDAPSRSEKSNLEYYLSWWVFANRYREQLQPRSVRQLKTWKQYYLEVMAKSAAAIGAADGRSDRSSLKRLPVMLFDNPANFVLIHRLTDEDDRLVGWLRRQDLASRWVDRRMFRINDSEIDEGAYTYDYIEYRYDVGIAMPVRDNVDDIISSMLLPSLVGRRFMRRFFQPSKMPRRHRRLGLARWLDHAAVPANCGYLFDISKLPDISFVPGISDETNADRRNRTLSLQSGDWEASLCENWMELIEDTHERAEDEYLLRYLREIVFEALRETNGVTSDALMMELDPPDAYEKRRHAVYEHFLADEIKSIRLSDVDRRIMFQERGQELKPEHLVRRTRYGTVERPERMLALYSALITDIRRAWHAIRIYQAAPDLAEDRDILAQLPFEHASFAAIANRDRMPILTLQELRKIALEATDWSRALLQVFNEKAITTTFPDAGHRVSSLFNPKGRVEKMHDTDMPQGLEEIEDWKAWKKTLRIIGRSVCEDWPILDGDPKRVPASERSFFRVPFGVDSAEGFRLDIFASDAKSGASKKGNNAQRNGRSARNFAWLIWGLAPSLPAIIHANVMSLAYKGELDWKAAEDYKKAKAEQRQALREDAVKAYDDALELTLEWTSLIGTLSMIIRYIRIKCLFLDLALFLERFFEGRGEDDALKRDAQILLKRAGYKIKEDGTDRDKALAGLRDLRNLFHKRKFNRNLAVSPDISPSSLFGDDWITDLLNQDAVKKIFDERGISSPPERAAKDYDHPLNTSGIFVETEQWLWASNRSLRKLYQAISKRRGELQRAPRKRQQEKSAARKNASRPRRGRS